MHRLSLQRQNDPNLAVSEQQGKKSARLLFPVKPTTQKEKKKKGKEGGKKRKISGENPGNVVRFRKILERPWGSHTEARGKYTQRDERERGGLSFIQPHAGESERRNFRSIRGRAKTPVLCKSRWPVPVINYSLGWVRL